MKRLALLFSLLVLVSAKRHKHRPRPKPQTISYESNCPTPVLCPDISNSNQCTTVTQFFIYKNGFCPSCGTCVENNPELDANGCPERSCPTPTQPNTCAYLWMHKQYIIYNDKVCRDCYAYTCNDKPSSAFSMDLIYGK